MELVAAAIVLIVAYTVWEALKRRRHLSGVAERQPFKFDDELPVATAASNPPPSDDRLRQVIELVETENDIKQAIQVFKLERKELLLHRRELSIAQRTVRAAHTHRVRQQLPKLPGGGKFGHSIRTVQTALRAQKRYQLAEALAPSTVAIDDIDFALLDLDWAILELERRKLLLGHG